MEMDETTRRKIKTLEEATKIDLRVPSIPVEHSILRIETELLQMPNGNYVAQIGYRRSGDAQHISLPSENFMEHYQDIITALKLGYYSIKMLSEASLEIIPDLERVRKT